jgi:hypothetical protein
MAHFEGTRNIMTAANASGSPAPVIVLVGPLGGEGELLAFSTQASDHSCPPIPLASLSVYLGHGLALADIIELAGKELPYTRDMEPDESSPWSVLISHRDTPMCLLQGLAERYEVMHLPGRKPRSSRVAGGGEDCPPPKEPPLPGPTRSRTRKLPADRGREGELRRAISEVGKIASSFSRSTPRVFFAGRPAGELIETAHELRRAADVLDGWAKIAGDRPSDEDEDDHDEDEVESRPEAIKGLALAIGEATGLTDAEACLRLAGRTYDEAIILRQHARKLMNARKPTNGRRSRKAGVGRTIV